MPGRKIQHVDLAVTDVERSLSFYRMLLEPLGLAYYDRGPTYRGTEEVIYFTFGRCALGLRPADGGRYRHYEVGLRITSPRQGLRATRGAPPRPAPLR